MMVSLGGPGRTAPNPTLTRGVHALGDEDHIDM